MYRNNQKYKDHQDPGEAAILKSDKKGWVNVSTPYVREFVVDIKTHIEPSGRIWNPGTKFWEVKEVYLERLLSILKKHFGDNIIQNLTDDDLSSNVFKPLFDILKGMPDGNIDKVYSALAFAIHPDRGGSDEQMKLLNSAYEEAKK